MRPHDDYMDDATRAASQPETSTCQREFTVAKAALWLNFLVFSSAFPAVLLAGIEIRHWHMTTAHSELQILIAFGTVALLNAIALWSAYFEGIDSALPSFRIALVANAIWQAIDMADWSWRHHGQLAVDVLAPAPDLVLCCFALWTLPRSAEKSWML